MTKILFTGALILIIVWAIAFFGYHVGGIIHILPAIALIALLIRLLYNKSLMR
jgi:uncharacterized membrane protein (GlpM family)